MQPSIVMKKTSASKDLQSSAKLVVLVWVVCMQAAAQLRMVEGEAHVTITNHLQQVLQVSCYSGDNNLGKHELNPNGVYEFSFTPNIWGNTMFWCTFKSDAYGRRTFRVWQGWLWVSRHITCKDCYWVVTPKGFKCNDEYLYSWQPW